MKYLLTIILILSACSPSRYTNDYPNLKPNYCYAPDAKLEEGFYVEGMKINKTGHHKGEQITIVRKVFWEHTSDVFISDYFDTNNLEKISCSVLKEYEEVSRIQNRIDRLEFLIKQLERRVGK